MKAWDAPEFFKYTRMTIPIFEKLLSKVKPIISRQQRKDGISAEERLVITLQYSSQGVNMKVLAWNFQIGHTTVHKIIHETCRTIWDVLSEKYSKCPSSEQEWLEIANGFERRWNFPHCLGSLDEKHINIQAPANSGSLYFNYKKNFSIVLLAACDSMYRFTFVDIGSQSDGGIFRNSIFGQQMDEAKLNIPAENTLENTNVKLPYFFVADEAFPLKKNIMRPYAGRNLTYTQRIFNYRLSRARQMIENSFGILVARWRILKTTINTKADNVDHIVKAVTVLHNYCLIELGSKSAENNIYCPAGYADSGDKQNGGWRQDQTPLNPVGRMSANYARVLHYKLRDALADYFTSHRGQVPWQDEMINRARILQ